MLNHIVLMGRLTRDPDLKYTGSNIAVTSFSLAVDRDFREKATGERKTDFIPCVAWRSTAEFISRNFSRGKSAVVSGRLQLRDWTDSDGNARKISEVVVENIYFADTKKADADPQFAELDDDGDLPF